MGSFKLSGGDSSISEAANMNLQEMAKSIMDIRSYSLVFMCSTHTIFVFSFSFSLFLVYIITFMFAMNCHWSQVQGSRNDALSEAFPSDDEDDN